MHKGKIVSCDTVAHLRANLKKYDELAVTCAVIDDDTLLSVSSLPYVVSCERSESGLTIQAQDMKGRFLEILKLIRERGISISSVSAHEPTLEDIYVDVVAAKSDADEKGIQPNDVITAVNGNSITGLQDGCSARNEFAAGDTVTLTVWRKGRTFDVEIRLLDRANTTEYNF